MTGKYHRVTVPIAAAHPFADQLTTAGYPHTWEWVYTDDAPTGAVFDVAVHDQFDIAAVDRKARRARQETT